MKTETQIVKENVGKLRTYKMSLLELVTHKNTCQRFLEFLEEEMKRWEAINELSEAYISTGELEDKITDLKSAIKLYEENGI